MNNYFITYTSNKHCYVKIEEGKLHLTLPKILKRDKQEHDRISKILLQKGQTLLKKHQKKTFLTTENYQEITLRGKKVSKKFFGGENTQSYLVASTKTETQSYGIKEKDIQSYLKKELYNYISPRVENIGAKLGFNNIPIRINKVKSKRGSCSYDNKLMFNLLLIHLPKKYTDYVIIHECCHLIHKNHSKDFWDLVSKYFPKYKEIRKEMKRFEFKD